MPVHVDCVCGNVPSVKNVQLNMSLPLLATLPHSSWKTNRQMNRHADSLFFSLSVLHISTLKKYSINTQLHV